MTGNLAAGDCFGHMPIISGRERERERERVNSGSMSRDRDTANVGGQKPSVNKRKRKDTKRKELREIALPSDYRPLFIRIIIFEDL